MSCTLFNIPAPSAVVPAVRDPPKVEPAFPAFCAIPRKNNKDFSAPESCFGLPPSKLDMSFILRLERSLTLTPFSKYCLGSIPVITSLTFLDFSPPPYIKLLYNRRFSGFKTENVSSEATPYLE